MLKITGGLCSWLACSLIKLEVSGSITTLEHKCILGACFLGFARFTLSLQYIYTRWSLSACSCSLQTLSPSPDLNKTSLASLSLPSLLVKEPSTGKGRRLNAVAVGKGGNPLPAQLFTFTQRRRGRASDPFFFAAVPSPTEPR